MFFSSRLNTVFDSGVKGYFMVIDLFIYLERLASTEDFYRSEQERYRLLTSDYESMRDEIVQLKVHLNKDKNDNNELIERQQNELDYLSNSITSKQNEHDQLLNVYLCFFLSCYLLIFFLFFVLLSW
jgi:predicted PurR-regulated permease PerM